MADSAAKAPAPAPVKRFDDKTPWGQFMLAFERDSRTFADNKVQALLADSFLNPQGYKQVFTDDRLGLGAKAAYVAGRVAHDVLTDGSRIPYWALNHPLAQLSVLGDVASQAAGLSPDYDVYRQRLEAADLPANRDDINAEFAKEHGFFHSANDNGGARIPLALARNAIPAMATAALTTLSDNTNYFNVLGGGRTAGFQAVLPKEGSFTETSNPLLELGSRYIFGRTGRVLPWEAFTQERPDVSKEDYDSYVRYQFDKGPLGIGLVRGTSRNLDGEPEYTMLGYRVPFSGATAAAGTMLGAIGGSKVFDGAVNGFWEGRVKLPERPGPRRLAGAAVGGLLGAIGGKLTGSAVNDLVIQPTLNPDKLAAADAWIAQQKAAGLL